MLLRELSPLRSGTVLAEDARSQAVVSLGIDRSYFF